MPATQFDRDSLAVWYAREHLRTDPGIVSGTISRKTLTSGKFALLK